MSINATFLLLALPLCASDDLFTLLRDGRVEEIQRVIAASPLQSVNARDEIGATPLMYAAALAPVEAVGALLSVQGIEVNAADQNGTTALMLAVRDVRKVQLLLDNGANINAANKEGTTAILASLRSRGNAATVRLLLAKGAELSVTSRVFRDAYRYQDSALLQALAEKGIIVKKKEDLGPRPLTTIGVYASLDEIRRVLEMGASPNELGSILTLTVPVLGSFANSGRLDAVKLLLDRGADPNLAGNKGYTALMMAAGAEPQNPAIVRALLSAGSEVNRKDKDGLTALDWALKQGETNVAALLRDAGGSTTEPRPEPAIVGAPRTPAAAVDKALPLLVAAAITSPKKVTCVNCHNNAMPAIAFATLAAYGRTVPGEVKGQYVAFYDEAAAKRWDRDVWFDYMPSYVGWALGEEGYARNPHTDVLSLAMLRRQREDGSWESDADHLRPPGGISAIKSTAFAIRDLMDRTPPRERDRVIMAAAKARQYLERVTAHDTQDAAFQLLGLRWSGGSKAMARLREELARLQREDGGWGQKPTMRSDPYATGQALTALHMAGLPVTHRTYQRGVQHLLRTQRDDGSWFVPTRAFGFQPYYEGGFPHGVHQYISATTTSWAVIALAYTLQMPVQDAK